MLAAFDRDNNIVHQDDDSRFEPTSTDTHIISTLAEECPKPVWITSDISQRKVPEERRALRNSAMTIFFFRKNNGAPHFQALKALAIWPTLVKYAATAKEPTAFQVPGGASREDQRED